MMEERDLPRLPVVGHANQWYLDAIRTIMAEGEKVTTRGRTTWEILHAVTHLPDPRKRVLTVPLRRANPFFQAMETVWILAGRSDAAWLTYYNSQMAKFLDPECEHFHGAYGERLVRWGSHQKDHGAGYNPINQIADVILQLRAESTSRRAVMVIHNPILDNPQTPTLDRPCNIALSYQLRHGRLYAATFNRSNDLNLGLAFTNICQFTTIQEFIAAALGVEVGGYTHFSSSLHVYEDDPIVQRLMNHPTSRAVYGSDLTSSVEPVSTPTFDVYRFAAPTSMAKWSHPLSGWQVIKVLEEVGDLASGHSRKGLEHQVWSISCPYWRSVGQLALAWHALKDEGREASSALLSALTYLSFVGMESHDWQIAGLEFVHRWACKRGVSAEFKELMESYVPFLEWPAPVREFILHDEGDK